MKTMSLRRVHEPVGADLAASGLTMRLAALDDRAVRVCRAAHPWVARVALALVYAWFGVVKLVGRSEASALAEALTAKTIGASHFHASFVALAWVECLIGAVVLVPRIRAVALVMIGIHMAIVCSPMVLVPDLTWNGFLLPTIEGQYILKNALVVAAVLAVYSSRPRAEQPVE